MPLSCSDELYAPFWEVASELGQQALAARQHIQPCCLEVAGVPGVCHIAGSGGVVQEQGDFPIRVAAAYTVHIPKIGAVHAYEEVVVGIILSGELTGGVARTGELQDAMDYKGSTEEKKARLFLANLGIDYDALTMEQFAR